MDKQRIDQIIREVISARLQFHSGETETQNQSISPDETVLPKEVLEDILSRDHHWGLNEEALELIKNQVGFESKTLEAGAGLSTVLFALLGCRHVVVTPNKKEFEKISRCLEQYDIPSENLTFIAQPSEVYLRRAKLMIWTSHLLTGNMLFLGP